MKKKIAAFVMAFSMLCGSTAFAAPAYSEWAESFAEEAESLGIIPDSISDGDMTEAITRERFCELLYNTISLISTQNSIKITYTVRESYFYDTNNQAVTALRRMGIVSGRTSTKFDPDASLTREEAASILLRAVNYLDLTTFTSSETFSDRKDISSYAKESVNIVCGMNIMSGMGDGTFNPTGTYTKEQAISTMIRLMNNVPDDSTKEKIDNNRYYISNAYYRWVEDENGNVVFKVSAEKYSGISFYSNGEKLLAFAVADGTTDVYDIESGKKLFTIDGTVAGTNSDKYIIAQNTDGTFFGVYDFEGNMILPIESSWEELYNGKYVTTQSRV
ncbi:MAG: S-layer homology domain-containing protein [Clostridiales bacterium]|nr:S-layer homology domain-containing protein [Clostridiales bacterium]